MKRFEPLPGERVILKSPKHWKNYIVPVLVILICLVAISVHLRYPGINLLDLCMGMDGFPAWVNSVLSCMEVATMILVILDFTLEVADTACTCYYVTDRRIIIVSSFLNVKTCEMLLERCETVSLRQSLPARMLNSGDIVCTSAGSCLRMEDVCGAGAFRRTLMRELTKHEIIRT